MCWVPVARSGSPGIRPQRLNCYCSGWIAGRRIPMDRPARRVALEAGIRPIRNGGVEFEASARPPERRAEGRHRGRVMERRAPDWTLGLEFPKQALARPWLSTCGRAGVKPGASQAGASTAVLAPTSGPISSLSEAFLRWKIQGLSMRRCDRSLKGLQSESSWVKYEVQLGAASFRALEKAMEGLGKPRSSEGNWNVIQLP